MSKPYFSDREVGPRPRTEEKIDENVRGGIIALVESRIADGSFGYTYPEPCPDGAGVYGTDERKFSLALKTEIPGIDWPLRPSEVPSTLAILNLVEFCHRSIAKPREIGYHSFFRHSHLEFNQEEGQVAFLEDVNRIFARNGDVLNSL